MLNFFLKHPTTSSLFKFLSENSLQSINVEEFHLRTPSTLNIIWNYFISKFHRKFMRFDVPKMKLYVLRFSLKELYSFCLDSHPGHSSQSKVSHMDVQNNAESNSTFSPPRRPTRAVKQTIESGEALGT